jgi:trehalose/maltose transport system substrate-binding protein
LYKAQEVVQAVPFFGSLYQVFVNTVVRPSAQTAPNYSRAQAIFTTVHEVLTGQKEPQIALEELEIDLGELVIAP